jgi:hypothetical protein
VLLGVVEEVGERTLQQRGVGRDGVTFT